MYRVGIGYDIHKLISGRDLIIGGIKITHEKGLLGHSDADVLIHAIIDAMLGALAIDDIGTLFPDTDARYKDIDSTVLLKHVVELVNEKGYDKKTGECLVEVDPKYFRPAEVETLLGDPTKAKSVLGWNPTKTPFKELVRLMVAHDMDYVKAEKTLHLR